MRKIIIIGLCIFLLIGCIDNQIQINKTNESIRQPTQDEINHMKAGGWYNICPDGCNYTPLSDWEK